MSDDVTTSSVAQQRSWLARLLSSGWLRLSIAAVVIGALIYFNRIDFGVLAASLKAWPWLLGALLLMIPPIAIVSYRFMLLLTTLGIEASFRQALRWTMIGSFFDLAMPSSTGGDIVKAGYVLNHVGAGRRTRAIMAVGFDRVIGMLGLFLLAGVAGVLGWNALRDLPARNLVVAMPFAIGVAFLVIFRIAGARYLHDHPRLNRWLSSHIWGQRLKQLIASFNALREKPARLAFALTLSILNHVFWCASLLLIAIALGNAVPLIKAFVVFPLAIFTNIFGVAGGFGVGTAGFDLLLSNLLSIKNGAAIGLLFQLLGVLWRLGGLPFYLASARDSQMRS
jgi:glycosyltransferase 2 family protein